MIKIQPSERLEREMQLSSRTGSRHEGCVGSNSVSVGKGCYDSKQILKEANIVKNLELWIVKKSQTMNKRHGKRVDNATSRSPTGKGEARHNIS